LETLKRTISIENDSKNQYSPALRMIIIAPGNLMILIAGSRVDGNTGTHGVPVADTS
jgi:hypothetical protein